jgi:thiol-disulfide isomerase/thioredoxin
MSAIIRMRHAALILVAALACASPAPAQSISGMWDGTVVFDGLSIPFRLEISGSGARTQGAFLNGDQRVTSTSGTFDGGTLVLHFDMYAETLRATLKDGQLTGTIQGKFDPGPPKTLPFQAKPYVAAPDPPAVNAPSIDGVWEIEVKSPKGESAWRFVVQQKGANVSAAILRVDGDTGALTGRYDNGRFLLTHFSGERPYILEAAPKPDGSLLITLHDYNGTRELPAFRPADARAKGLPEPTDPSRHTHIADATQPFQFSFPDFDGRIVSSADARFRGKVVLAVITGSWCPNCHDEAPFLAELYRKYRSRGLEIVALDFEEAEQLRDLTRLRAFVKHYGIEYTTLVGGEPEQVNQKLPQLVNLNSWPTTVIIGRDGLVKGVHAGFASPASGGFNGDLKREITSRVESLLAENPSATSH